MEIPGNGTSIDGRTGVQSMGRHGISSSISLVMHEDHNTSDEILIAKLKQVIYHLSVPYENSFLPYPSMRKSCKQSYHRNRDTLCAESRCCLCYDAESQMPNRAPD